MITGNPTNGPSLLSISPELPSVLFCIVAGILDRMGASSDHISVSGVPVTWRLFKFDRNDMERLATVAFRNKVERHGIPSPASSPYRDAGRTVSTAGTSALIRPCRRAAKSLTGGGEHKPAAHQDFGQRDLIRD